MVGCALTAHLKDDMMTRDIVEVHKITWPELDS